MQDGIIKGTGNSRYLKSISNFLTQYPTYQDFVAALVAGTLPIDLNGINETGWDQLGTALNKANLLSDETAALLGLPNTAVPDDAFLQLYGITQSAFRYKILNSTTFENISYVDFRLTASDAKKNLCIILDGSETVDNVNSGLNNIACSVNITNPGRDKEGQVLAYSGLSSLSNISLQVPAFPGPAIVDIYLNLQGEQSSLAGKITEAQLLSYTSRGLYIAHTDNYLNNGTTYVNIRVSISTSSNLNNMKVFLCEKIFSPLEEEQNES